MSEPEATSAFAEAFPLVDGIGGWLTGAQAALLWSEAAALPDGALVVEVGSHQGRSTVTLALANPTATVVAIDPFVEGRKFGGAPTKDVLLANLRAAGVTGRVDLREARSDDVRHDWAAPVSLVYVDGKHDYWSAGSDFGWAAHLPPGGRLLVHDAFSSIGVTLAVLRFLLPSRRLRYVDRTGSLARFEVGTPRREDRVRLLAQLPWWARNVGLKVLLRLRLRPVARLLGHHGSADPY